VLPAFWLLSWQKQERKLRKTRRVAKRVELLDVFFIYHRFRGLWNYSVIGFLTVAFASATDLHPPWCSWCEPASRSQLVRERAPCVMQFLCEENIGEDLFRAFGWLFRVNNTYFSFTPWKINIEPENGELEDYFPFPGLYSQVPC